MGELCDVTIQYTSCADPTESAARKQRVLQGEAQGLMAQTAALIIESATQAHLAIPSPFDNHFSVEQPLSPDVPVHPAQIQQIPPIPPKKKKGRPPLTKPICRSPIRLAGAKTSKRQLCNIQSSPIRRHGDDSVSTSSKSSSQRRQHTRVAANLASSSKAPPTRPIIPATVKGRVDFPNPPPPLP